MFFVKYQSIIFFTVKKHIGKLVRSMLFEEFEGKGNFMIKSRSVVYKLFNVIGVACLRGCSMSEVFRT